MTMIAKKRAFVKNQYAFSAFFRKEAVKSVLFPDKLPVFLAESLFYNFVRIQHNGKWPIIAQ